MGTLAAGMKEIFSSSQTTATHLPTCSSDGTPTGRISTSDLASVLGVGWKFVNATQNNYVYIHEAEHGCTFEIRYWTEAYAIYTTVKKPAGGGVLSPILSTTGFDTYLEVYCEANSYKIKVKSSSEAGGDVGVYYRYIK